jgi:3-hydroxyacyl-[acyl-carrier-protein] dehydratase
MLVDRVVEWEPGRRIVTEKAVSLAEEYLADHFPKFPVLPGVFMLEAMVQSSAWLVRLARDFAPTLVVLKEAKNVTYKSFAAPGRVLRLEAVAKEIAADRSLFQASGAIGDREVVRGQLVLRHLTMAETGLGSADQDESLRSTLRGWWELIARGAAGSPPAAQSAAI